MRKLASISVFLVCLAIATSSQTSVTGKWQGLAPLGAHAFDLHAEGATLTGTVSLGGRMPEPIDGTIDGNRVTFTVAANATYEGVVNGDEIAFILKRAPAGNEQRFSAHRVSEFRAGPLAWRISVYDRRGNLVRTLGEPSYSNALPVLSPDGTRLAVVQPVPGSPGMDISVFDVSTGARIRAMTGPAPSGPVWSPDGTQIAYYAYRQRRGGLYRKNANGTGREELLYRFPSDVSDGHLTDWSPDGRFLVFDTSAVVWVLPLGRDGEAVELLRGDSHVFGARLSPDSRLLAYVSDESGRNEIYVRAFDASAVRLSSSRTRVSRAGGEGMVHWRGDARELYYLAPDGDVMVTDVTVAPSFSAGAPRSLFRSPVVVPSVGNTDDDRNGRMSRHGERVAFAAPPMRQVVTVAAAILAQYEGTYANRQGVEVVVTRNGDQLVVPIVADGQHMHPASESSFFNRGRDSDVDVDFVKDAKGAVTHLVVYRGATGVIWNRAAAGTRTTQILRGGAFPWRLTEFDRQGGVVRTIGEPGSYGWAVFSPDGTRVAVSPDSGQGSDIRVLDGSTGTNTQVVAGPLRTPVPVWSPDGRYIAFVAQRTDYFGLYRKSSDGTGREQLLFRFPPGVADVVVTDWSPDGRFLAFTTGAPGVMSVLPLTAERVPIELIREDFGAFGARFSPDNRFLAYVSDESGRNEVFVREFDASSVGFSPTDRRWQVSSQGGVGPIQWGRDGRELFYMAPDGGVMGVDVTVNPAFSGGSPRLLFRAPPGRFGSDYLPGGSISRDGRFLFRVRAPPERRIAAPALEVLAEYVGTYVNPRGAETVVTLEGNRLMLNRGAGQGTPLAAASETSFFQRTVTRDVDFEFVRDQDGRVVHFLEYGGGTVNAPANSSIIWVRK